MAIVIHSGSDDRDLTDHAADRILAMAQLALSQCEHPVESTGYLVALRAALWEVPLPFGTDVYADHYRAASADGQWLAVSLISKVENAGDRARLAWSLAAGSIEPEERRVLKGYAVDASHHVLANAALLDLVFPDMISMEFRRDLETLCPHYSMEHAPDNVGEAGDRRHPTIDDFLQMNIAGLRMAVCAEMERHSVIAHCPTEDRLSAVAALGSLFQDGLRHVADTAVLIVRRSRGGEPADLRPVFSGALRQFDRMTSEEPIEFSYHQRFGNYP